MSYENYRYQFVGREGNDGRHAHLSQRLIERTFFEENGIKEIEGTETEIKKALTVKEFVYGELDTPNYETVLLPNEIYFKNKITGALAISRSVQIEDILNTDLDLILYDKRNQKYHLKNVKDIIEEYYEKEDSKNPQIIFSSVFESPFIVEYSPHKAEIS
jgi:hypothetical protein